MKLISLQPCLKQITPGRHQPIPLHSLGNGKLLRSFSPFARFNDDIFQSSHDGQRSHKLDSDENARDRA